tara:strand:- start:17130 stop:17303 length:174 start_codon:yes stop_codon:yes gene_type:complete
MKKKSPILIVAGILVIVVSQMIKQFATTSDFLGGAILGIGIGLLIMAVAINRPKSAN